MNVLDILTQQTAINPVFAREVGEEEFGLVRDEVEQTAIAELKASQPDRAYAVKSKTDSAVYVAQCCGSCKYMTLDSTNLSLLACNNYNINVTPIQTCAEYIQPNS